MFSSIPDWHCKPKIRLQKSIHLQSPDSHPPAVLRSYDFHEPNGVNIRKKPELVHDPCGQVSWSGPKFSGDFECGNLGEVYFYGGKEFEIHLLPDPNENQTTQWFFFRVENMDPGEYSFTIVGFYRPCNLHWKGSKVCAYSDSAARNGIGWQRIGENLNYFKWKGGKNPEWAFSFTFSVTERDAMYFAHAYPYTYTDLNRFLARLSPECKVSSLCKTVGDISVPGVFWDAEKQKCVELSSLFERRRSLHEAPLIRLERAQEFSESLLELLRSWKEGRDYPNGVSYSTKPVIVIAARTHPGETNSSYAMEGLMNLVFAQTQYGIRLREAFSWLLLPMMNPDGVICGFYRPDLSGDDPNRVWQSPDPVMSPVASCSLNLLDSLRKTRPLLFFLDFHGHTAACNSFVYGFMNEDNPDLYSAERVFPLLMTKHSPLFSNEQCSFLKQKQYEGTMRVVIRRRFLILFAYTLEMSYGGCVFGPRRNTQFTPHDYRSIGEATARSIGDLLMSRTSLAAQEVMTLLPWPEPENEGERGVPAQILLEGETWEGKMSCFNVSVGDITVERPRAVRLTLKQMTRDSSIL
jgi:hypothetical protein